MVNIYLSGSFFREGGDWRYDIVTSFRIPPLVKHPDMDQFTVWGILEKSIMEFLDYSGPFPEEESLAFKTKHAIERADLLFVWADKLTGYEISWVNAEIGYANASSTFVSVGTTSIDNPSYIAIEGAEALASHSPMPFVASSPTEAFREFIEFALEFAPLGKLVDLYLNQPLSRPLLKNQYHRCGYVYLIKADTGEYKIGRSKNIPERMNLFAVKLPFDFQIIHYFPCLDMYDCEAFMHHLFGSQRKRGEWFNLTHEDEETIRQVKCFYNGYFADQKHRNVFRIHPRFKGAWESYRL